MSKKQDELVKVALKFGSLALWGEVLGMSKPGVLDHFRRGLKNKEVRAKVHGAVKLVLDTHKTFVDSLG